METNKTRPDCGRPMAAMKALPESQACAGKPGDPNVGWAPERGSPTKTQGTKGSPRGTVDEARVQADPTWKGLYRIGGVCLLLTGVAYIACAVVSVVQGSPPVTDSESYLNSLATHPMSARISYELFAFTDFLLLPAVVALYLGLKQIARNAVLVATALMVLFVVLDLAVTESTSLTLVALTQHDAASTTDMERSAYRGAEDYALATLPLATFYSFMVSSIGLLIIGVVMLKGVFSRPTAYAGIVASVEGIVGSFYLVLPALALLLIPCLIAFGIWSVLAGVRLYRLCQYTVPPIHRVRTAL